MKTTIIIPTHNRAKLVGHAIRSLLAQKQDFEPDILVIDDGSTDDTAQVIAALAAQHPEIRYIARENGGVAAARNTGLENLLEDTEFVTFLDSDDLSVPQRFALDLPLFYADPDLDLTYGRMIVTENLDYQALAPTKNSKIINFVSIHLSSAIFRRRLFDRIGHFDESFTQAEDTDLLFRIFETDTKFIQTKTVCHYYLRHVGNMSDNPADVRKYFAKAIFASVRRRRLDPKKRLVTPDFKVQHMEFTEFK